MPLKGHNMQSYKIIHIPSYQRDNAYQNLLLDNLKKLGLDVAYGRMIKYFSLVDISLLFNAFTNSGADIIHLHWQHPFLLDKTKFRMIVKSLLFIIQLSIIKIFGIKLIWTVHNLKNHENTHEGLEIFFSRIIARYADAIIAHGEAAKLDIQRVFKVKKIDKIVVIQHGNYLNAYKNTVYREEARHRLNLSSTDLTFLCLGRVRPYKGVLELIESFQKLDSSLSRLIIAGTPQDKQLVNLIEKKAGGNSSIRLILRFIPDDEIQIFMNAADIVILPYRDILVSGAAILGMSFGKAIIAPRLGCIPDILDSLGSFLYDPDDQDCLLNVMKQALVSRIRLREMGDHNLELAKKLDWENIAASTYNLYEKCLSR